MPKRSLKQKAARAKQAIDRLWRHELKRKEFRVVVFGSARIKDNSKVHKEVYRLAEQIAIEGMDVVTGGGPGLMDAASEGHYSGRMKAGNGTHSIGLQIHLPHEQHDAKHLDVKRDFDRFSERLDTFVLLSNCIVVAPGGVGTLLEFLYTWQLMQVEMTCKLPIILLGDMWPPLLDWLREYPLKRRLLDAKDLQMVHLAKDVDEAMDIIRKARDEYVAEGKNACLNVKKYSRPAPSSLKKGHRKA